MEFLTPQKRKPGESEEPRKKQKGSFFGFLREEEEKEEEEKNSLFSERDKGSTTKRKKEKKIFKLEKRIRELQMELDNKSNELLEKNLECNKIRQEYKEKYLKEMKKKNNINMFSQDEKTVNLRKEETQKRDIEKEKFTSELIQKAKTLQEENQKLRIKVSEEELENQNFKRVITKFQKENKMLREEYKNLQRNFELLNKKEDKKKSKNLDEIMKLKSIIVEKNNIIRNLSQKIDNSKDYETVRKQLSESLQKQSKYQIEWEKMKKYYQKVQSKIVNIEILKEKNVVLSKKVEKLTELAKSKTKTEMERRELEEKLNEWISTFKGEKNPTVISNFMGRLQKQNMELIQKTVSSKGDHKVLKDEYEVK